MFFCYLPFTATVILASPDKIITNYPVRVRPIQCDPLQKVIAYLRLLNLIYLEVLFYYLNIITLGVYEYIFLSPNNLTSQYTCHNRASAPTPTVLGGSCRFLPVKEAGYLLGSHKAAEENNLRPIKISLSPTLSLSPFVNVLVGATSFVTHSQMRD